MKTHHTAVWVIALLGVLLLACGRTADNGATAATAPDPAPAAPSLAQDAAATPQPVYFMRHVDDNDKAQTAVFGNWTGVTPLVEECCTEIGKKDECWWEDAAADGVTCKKTSDCLNGKGCHASGLCTCDDDSDCNNGTTKQGICAEVDHDNNPSTPKIKLCGPSYCNGFLQCDCWGGCAWWHDDPNFTPKMDAESQNLVCCEGTYPEGSDKLITFYTPTLCEHGVPVGSECTFPTDCPAPADQCQQVDCVSGFCIFMPDPGKPCDPGTGIPPTVCHDYACNTAGQCVLQSADAGSDCTGHLDTVAYPTNCFDPLCGDITNDMTALLYTVGAANGVCEAAVKPAALNDLCTDLFTGGALNTTNPGYIGSFGNTETTVRTVHGSTRCAGNHYRADGPGCTTAGDPLGKDGPDVVYAFEYESNSADQNQLYGFVITLEANYDAQLYVVEDVNSAADCPVPGGSIATNRCLRTYTGGAVWEEDANKMGNQAANQQCCSGAGCASNGYHWCERGSWTMPDAPVPFNDTLSGAPKQNLYSPISGRDHISSSVVFVEGVRPTGPAGTNRRVLVFVDGATAARKGDFTLSVERRAWNASPCERINDDPRVYDITLGPAAGAEGVYQGNLRQAVNSWHQGTGSACGGFPCTDTWQGVTPDHTGLASKFWPNVEYFKIHPLPGAPTRDYCVKLVAPTNDAADAVVEVRYPKAAPHTGALCALNSYDLLGTAKVGDNGVTISDVAANDLYLVGVSNRTALTAPCTANCNYQLEVTEGACPPGPPTGEADCAMQPPVLYKCGSSLDVYPAGIITMDTLSGAVKVSGGISTLCSTSFPDSSYGLPTLGYNVQWLLDNRTHRNLNVTAIVVRNPYAAHPWWAVSTAIFKCEWGPGIHKGTEGNHTIPGWFPDAWNFSHPNGQGNMKYLDPPINATWPPGTSWLGGFPDIYNQNVHWAGVPLYTLRPASDVYHASCPANGGKCCGWNCPGPIFLIVQSAPKQQDGNPDFPDNVEAAVYYYDLYVSWTDGGAP